jgi:GNAT superfamily N-acetyltransferase
VAPDLAIGTMSSMPDLAEFVAESASRAEWSRYHRYRRRMHEEWRPDEPLPPDDVAELRLKRRDPFQHHRRYHVSVGAEMVGALDAEAPRPESPEYETNRHLLWLEGYVLEPYRRRGIGGSCVPTVLSMMEEHGATVLTTWVEDESGHAFLHRLGAEPRLTERASRLDLRQVDWEMVARWVSSAEAASPGARLELHPQWVPAEMLEEHCAALTELMNTMPFEGMDHGDIVVTADSAHEWRARMVELGAVNPTCVVREADGSISGITDVLKHPYEPGIVRQNFTGVHPRARGRGLGKWLKAAMLEHVRRAYPDTISVTTENAGSNAPMLAINHALGFRLHRTQTFYQVERETLRGAATAAGQEVRGSDT